MSEDKCVHWMSIFWYVSVGPGMATDSFRRLCCQQNLQLVSPDQRLCMKMDVKAENSRKPAAGPFPNGPLASSSLNWNNRIILEL